MIWSFVLIFFLYILADKDAIIWYLLSSLIPGPYITKLASDTQQQLGKENNPSAAKKRKITKRRVTPAEARYSSFLILPVIAFFFNKYIIFRERIDLLVIMLHN